jgi:hypothetical protein
MPKNKEGHGIVLDEMGQEQPKDKDRAQQKPGHMPPQPTKREEATTRCSPRGKRAAFSDNLSGSPPGQCGIRSIIGPGSAS